MRRSALAGRGRLTERCRGAGAWGKCLMATRWAAPDAKRSRSAFSVANRKAGAPAREKLRRRPSCEVRHPDVITRLLKGPLSFAWVRWARTSATLTRDLDRDVESWTPRSSSAATRCINYTATAAAHLARDAQGVMGSRPLPALMTSSQKRDALRAGAHRQCLSSRSAKTSKSRKK